MTQSAHRPRTIAVGTSGGTRGPFNLTDELGNPIYFGVNADIDIYRYSTAGVRTLLTETTDYTITGGPTTGVLNLTTAQALLVTNEKLVAERKQTISQLLALTAAGAFPSASVEERLDVITRILQELNDQQSRALSLSRTELSEYELPPARNRGPADSTTYLLGFDQTTGTPTLINSNFTSVTSAAIDAVAGSATNIPALRLKTWTGSNRPQIVGVQYAFTAGDAAGWYRLDAADTSTTDDGFLCIVDAASNRWKRIIQSVLPLRGGNALNDNSGDVKTVLDGALDGSGGIPVDVPIGRYRLDSAQATTGPVSLVGHGTGAGPGAVLNTNASQFMVNFTTGDVMTFGPSLYGPRLENLQFNLNSTARTSGAATLLTATGLSSVMANWRIDNVAYSGQFDDIGLYQVTHGTITRTYHQAFTRSAIRSRGDGAHESSGGWWAQNYFFGDASASVAATQRLVDLSHGYTQISDSSFVGGAVGVYANINEYPAAALRVTNNWIEEQDISGIYVLNGSSQVGKMFAFNWNEFSTATLSAASRTDFIGHINIVAGSTNWLAQFQVIGNFARSAAAASGASLIDIGSGDRGTVAFNNLEGLTGNTMKAIRVTTQPTAIALLDNIISGTFGGKYDLTGTKNVLLRDLQTGLTVAEANAIAGACQEGSAIKVTDGRPGSLPLTGGGSGCIAVMRNSQWEGETERGKLILLNSGTVSSAATLDVVLSSYGSGFRGYELELDSMLPASDDKIPWLRFSTDGGSSFNAGANDYRYAANAARNDGTIAAQIFDGGSGVAQIALGRTDGSGTGVGSSSDEGFTATIKMMNASTGAFKGRVMYDCVYLDATVGIGVWRVAGAGYRAAAQDTDALRFMFNSGSIASGRWALYGIR